MKTIHKFEIPVEDRFEVEIPPHCILNVDVQNGTPYFWAMLDTDDPKRTRCYSVFGTGHPLPQELLATQHIGSFQMHGGRLVFHLFDLGWKINLEEVPPLG